MNMDVMNDRIIDIGLNVIGYMAAGLLWMLVYTVYTSRRKVKAETEGTRTGPQVKTAAGSTAETLSTERRKIEFVSFDQPLAEVGPNPALNSESRVTASSSRRNRVEIIRIARQMIEAGSSNDKIRSTLPISDGELTLLSRANRR